MLELVSGDSPEEDDKGLEDADDVEELAGVPGCEVRTTTPIVPTTMTMTTTTTIMVVPIPLRRSITSIRLHYGDF